MSFLITLSSTADTSQPTNSFVTRFSPRLTISPESKVALVSASIWYSWSNIAPEYNNNTFRYYNGTEYKTIVIPAGNYQLPQLNAFIKAQMKVNNDYDAANDEAYISLEPNYSTLRCDLMFSAAAITKGIRVDFSTGELRTLLGFAAAELSVTTEGTNQVDITRGVTSIHIRSDIHSGSVDNGSGGEVIWSFTPALPPGNLLNIEPNTRIYLPVRSSTLDQVRMWITDQRGQPIDLRGEHTSFKLAIDQPESANDKIIELLERIANK